VIRAGIGFDHSAELQAGNFRQHQIKNNQSWRLVFDHGKRGSPVIGNFNGESFAPQMRKFRRKQEAIADKIFDDSSAM
jgi:hypothetical protein